MIPADPSLDPQELKHPTERSVAAKRIVFLCGRVTCGCFNVHSDLDGRVGGPSIAWGLTRFGAEHVDRRYSDRRPVRGRRGRRYGAGRFESSKEGGDAAFQYVRLDEQAALEFPQHQAVDLSICHMYTRERHYIAASQNSDACVYPKNAYATYGP